MKQKKIVLVAFENLLFFLFLAFSLLSEKYFRYQINRLVSKIQLKKYFAVSTLFIVSLTSFVGEHDVITQTSSVRLLAAERIVLSPFLTSCWR